LGWLPFPSIVSSDGVKIDPFQLLHAKDDSRIEEQIYCIAEDKILERKELVHDFQIQNWTAQRPN
jgi:hypothetical protein